VESLFSLLRRLPEKYQKLLAGREEQVRRNKDLVTIRDDAPLTVHLSDFSWSTDRLQGAIPLLERYGMKSLIKRVTQPTAAPPDAKVEQESLL
jgi:5'-3' exonuclease